VSGYLGDEEPADTIARLRSSLDKAHERETEKKARISTLEAKLAESERASKGDADLIALLRKQVDWSRQHMTYEPEPDWSEVMKAYHALTPEPPTGGASDE